MELPLGEFANSPPEVHALAYGFKDGFFKRHNPLKIPTDIRDVEKEKPYYIGAYTAGWFLKLGLIIYFGPELVQQGVS